MAAKASGRGIPAPLTWVAGVAAVVLGTGLGELTAGLVAPASSPIAVVGSTLIDLAPPWAKDTAIALFGTGDKAALLIGISLVLLVLAALAGWIEVHFPPWGVVLVAVIGVAVAILAVTRPSASGLAWLPAAVAGAAGAVALWMLARMLSLPAAAASEVGSSEAAATPAPQTRRVFLAWAGTAVAAGVLATVFGSLRTTASAGIAAARRALHLPTPAVAASAVPEGAELDIPGLARVVTPNDSFYRIDTALVVPEVDPSQWRLRIHGKVANEVELTWDDLLALPLEESWTTLTCVSNEVGGTLIGNARWLGYPIRELLARARPDADADMVLSRSVDGFTASTPLEVLTDDRAAILAVGMNGEPLPLEHGFPVRMVVPGLYGYVSATKWVVDLEVTRFADATAYWTTRGWSERGPIKLESRIDVPRKGQGLKAGQAVIAGVAWQQQVGIESVEVRIDEGEWMPATLASAISDDTWVQWSTPWAATTGDHVIQCRATSKAGEVQTEDTAPPAPDGATGWHWRTVTVFD